MGLVDSLRTQTERQAYALIDAAIATLKDVLDNPEGCWTPQDQLQAAKIILDHLKD